MSGKINCSLSSQGKLVTPLVGHSRIEEEEEEEEKKRRKEEEKEKEKEKKRKEEKKDKEKKDKEKKKEEEEEEEEKKTKKKKKKKGKKESVFNFHCNYKVQQFRSTADIYLKDLTEILISWQSLSLLYVTSDERIS